MAPSATSLARAAGRTLAAGRGGLPPSRRVRKIASYRNEHGELWVNVASSRLVLDGFVNLDRSVFLALAPAFPLLRPVLPARHAAIVGELWDARRRAHLAWFDCRRPLPFESGTVDHVLCSHYLEHLPPPAMRHALADYARVLRPGGTLHLVLPDLRYAVDRYVRGETDADELLAWQLMRSPTGLSRRARLLDAVAGLGVEHQWMYDHDTAARRVLAAGFKIALTSGPTPSDGFRRHDPESLHVHAVRP